MVHTLQLIFKMVVFGPSEVMLLQHKQLGLMWAGQKPFHHLCVHMGDVELDDFHHPPNFWQLPVWVGVGIHLTSHYAHAPYCLARATGHWH